MYSDAYYRSVENSRQYHLKKDIYSGVATVQYHYDIKELVDKHNAKTLLDYGCGKAFHYFNKEKCQIWFGGPTFDQWLGLDSFYLFDPCIDQFSKHPEEGAKFDSVIAIQSLAGIPDADFPTVVNQLMKMTNKFCFIGNKLKKGKSSKGNPALAEYYKGDRVDPDWWNEQFKGWQGSELVLKFIE
jgi:hypothetical protein